MFSTAAVSSRTGSRMSSRFRGSPLSSKATMVRQAPWFQDSCLSMIGLILAIRSLLIVVVISVLALVVFHAELAGQRAQTQRILRPRDGDVAQPQLARTGRQHLALGVLGLPVVADLHPVPLEALRAVRGRQ